MQTNIASNDLTLKMINDTLQSRYQNTNQLNETMVIMQTNIASNDLTLKTINETLQTVVKTPGENGEYIFFIKWVKGVPH